MNHQGEMHTAYACGPRNLPPYPRPSPSSSFIGNHHHRLYWITRWERSARPATVISFLYIFFVSFYSLASTTPLTYLYRTRYDPTVSPSTIIIAIICVAIFSLLLLPLRPSNRMTWLTSRERESSALDLILLSGAQLFNTSIITTMSESLYIVRVHSS